MTDDSNDSPKLKIVSKPKARGWVFIALEPAHLFTIHTLLRREIRSTRKAKSYVPKYYEELLMADYVLDGVCSSLVGTSAEE